MIPNVLYNTQITSFVDVTLVHHLLGLEDILVMHAVDALGYVNAIKFINATITTILIHVDEVLFKFSFISAIKAKLLQPLAELCMIVSLVVAIWWSSCFELNRMAVPVSILCLPNRARERLWMCLAALWLHSPPLAPVGFLCNADRQLWWRCSNDHHIRSTIQTVLYNTVHNS